MRPKNTGDVQSLPLGPQIVTAIQGRPVSTAVPPKGGSLVWNGSAYVPGGRLASGTRAATVSTAGTTFAAGADLLSTALSFTADGTSSYLVRVAAPAISNNTATDGFHLRINLDGADAGVICSGVSATASQSEALLAEGVFTPAAGAHTLNVRLNAVTGGTAAVNAGTGGAGGLTPIFVSIEKV